VHAGLLARGDDRDHAAALARHGFAPIDLLCVNLYPFAATAARQTATPAEVIEQIDIGGPAMLRAAAKNHEFVLVVVRPERYAAVLTALQRGDVGADFRQRLAAEAFAHTAAYDSAVAAWLRREETGFPEEMTLTGSLAGELRYGENPHQRAAWYRTGSGGLGSARQVQGPELSYNNLQDAAAALALVQEFSRPAAAIIKHTNPCGLALADAPADAYRRAYECDSVSAYGGVVALNRPLDAATADQMRSVFLELVMAPKVCPDAAQVLESKSKLRVLEAPARGDAALDVRSLGGGFLVQTADDVGFDRASCRVVTQREPDAREWQQLELAWVAAKHVKSNAIVLARDDATVGIGAGQTSRVESVRIAIARAGARAAGSVMGSDAFFPFADGIATAAEAGVTAVIQPGGSIRDEEVVPAADAAGMAMVFTGSRHFRH
jgi:phosphoribosylaminoimidazolecarboxamide formyltransferase/IMP cyclohydrolase